LDCLPAPPTRAALLRWAALLGLAAVPCLAVLLAACGAPPESSPRPDAGGEPEVFIALQRDFLGYTTWRAFDVGSEPIDGVHTVGTRRVYLNAAPPPGRSGFPVGTILVKTIAGEDNKTFAMVKRGGTYNANGARGWEWFELRTASDGNPAIAWRGVAPPTGEGYSAAQGGTCNGCHAAAADNDFVQSPPLRLSHF
jgi:hypothetical protein